MKSFFLAMILNPEVQAKAQKELDDVVGHGNFPEFSHQSALPYIDGIVKESLRWRPVAPQGTLKDEIRRKILTDRFWHRSSTCRDS